MSFGSRKCSLLVSLNYRAAETQGCSHPCSRPLFLPDPWPWPCPSTSPPHVPRPFLVQVLLTVCTNPELRLVRGGVTTVITLPPQKVGLPSKQAPLNRNITITSIIITTISTTAIITVITTALLLPPPSQASLSLLRNLLFQHLVCLPNTIPRVWRASTFHCNNLSFLFSSIFFFSCFYLSSSRNFSLLY